MQKILNALRYGNTKTKVYIVAIFLLFVCCAVSAVLAWIHVSPLWAMISVFSFVLAIIFISSVSFKGPVTKKIIEKKEKQSRKGKSNEKIKKLAQEEGTKEEDEKKENEENDEDGYLQEYSEDKIKKLFVSYKVNKGHVPIMIDSCRSERIRQCPAYAWVEKKSLYLLLLDRESRMVEIPLRKDTKIVYEKGIPVNRESDYAEFKKPSFVSLVFQSLLPTTYEDGKGFSSQTKKNLYVLTPDLMVTNTSAKALMDLLSMDMTLKEEEIYTKSYSPYFTAAYKLSIQLRDGVLSVKDYKLKIKDVLQKLGDAEISLDDFGRYIKQLVDGRLITKEYADYYVEYRRKRNKVKQETR